jgi:hypothetical protein
MKTYAAMRKRRPDFFIHNGGTIYADGPIAAEVKLPDGSVWKNVTLEEKAKPAETLAEFRGGYKYNLFDSNLREFNAAVPMFAQWDDHEVTNNWWPEEPLTRAEHQRKNYTEKNMMALAARAARAFHETCRFARSRRTRPRVPQNSVWSIARRIYARYARLSRSLRKPTVDVWAGCVFSRPCAAGVAEAGAQSVARHLEGHRRRYANYALCGLRH